LPAEFSPAPGPVVQRAETDIFLHHLVRFGENETDKEITDHLEEVAKKLGKSMAAVAVA
jgi:aryl-alcohol dehydrogenase-like predicted oxidoreductase